MLPTSAGRLLAPQAREAIHVGRLFLLCKDNWAATRLLSMSFVSSPFSQDFQHLLGILGAFVVLDLRDKGAP